MRKTVIIIAILLSVAIGFSAETLTNEPPVAVASCDAPLGSYKCYDTSKSSYCQGVNLFYVRGYCTGGNNIQCCAPKGFPEGPRVNGPGITDYGRCDIPNADYRCYDNNEIPSCPNPSLKFVTGWCRGGNAIQCCAPPGTPEGVRTGGPGVEIVLGPETKTADFDLLLEGLLSCEYTVKSNGVVTKKAKFACNERVKITVGPKGDCRDEGPDTCEVINDGGYLGVTKSYKFSIKFVKPAKTFGNCEKYGEFQCLQEVDCKATGGTPLKGYCPNIKDPKVKCCIHQATFNIPGRGVFILDKTKDKIVTDLSGIDAKLNALSKFNAEIRMEILDDITSAEERVMRNKYHLDFELDKSPAKLSMVIVYLKSKNAWPVIQQESCGIDQKTFEEIIANPGVEQKINEKDYSGALNNFVDLLKDVISKRSAAGDVCKKSASEGSCQKQCDEKLFGIGGCSLEKCVNIDGCIWNGANNNAGSCEDICPGAYQDEVSLIKRSEDCAGVKCHDAYLCRNGKVIDGPIQVAASTTTPIQEGLDIEGPCAGLSQSFIDGYNIYKSSIRNAIDEHPLNVENPASLIAGMITFESGWKPQAKSRCGSVGIAQFTPATGRSYGLNVPGDCKTNPDFCYEFNEVGECNKVNCGGKIPSACNYCTPEKCKPEDERLDAEKSIAAMVPLVSDLIAKCGNVNDALLAYANGACGLRTSVNPDYDKTVMKYYSRWNSCFAKQLPLSEIENNVDLPEGTFRITEMARITGEGENVKFTKQSGEPASLQCNINPATGISGYWMKLYSGDEKIPECTGLHGVEPPGQACERFVDNQKIARLFSGTRSGTFITIKDPYSVGEGDATSGNAGIADNNDQCAAECRNADPSFVTGKCESAAGSVSRLGAYGCSPEKYCNCYASSSADSCAGGKNILIIGDSHAEGLGIHGNLGAEISGLCGKAGVKFNRGTTIQDWTGGLTGTNLESALQSNPDVVFVVLGTNDAKYSVNPSTVAQSASMLLEKIGNREIIWVGPPKMSLYRRDADVQNVISGIKTEFSGRFYDTFISIPLLTSGSSDGIHPTARGYSSWAKEIGKWYRGESLTTPAAERTASSESVCKVVCSGFLDKAYSIISSADCKKRCGELGCTWENGKCGHSSICLVHKKDESKIVNPNTRRILFLPIFTKVDSEYYPSYTAFKIRTEQDVSFLSNVIPTGCGDKFVATIPTETEFNKFKKDVCPSGVDALGDFAEDYGYDHDSFDILVGVGGQIENLGGGGSRTVGASSCIVAEETREVRDLGKGFIWTSSDREGTFAHEIGHLFGLNDQYCSLEAGSRDSRCNSAADLNPLLPELGCDPKAKSGQNVCCGKAAGFKKECSEAGYEVCCLGNKVGGGRSLMSGGGPNKVGFDTNELKQIANALGCGSNTAEISGDSGLVFRLENAIKSKHPSADRKWAETVVKHAKYKTPENAALIAAIIEKETNGAFIADPSAGIFDSIGKIIGASNSLGCMQVQKANAEQIARETGRNPDNVASDLRTMDGCIFYGSKYIEKVLDIYAKDGKINPSVVPILAAGYNANKYAPRNAAFQEQINDVLGTKAIQQTTGRLIKIPAPLINDPGPTESAIRKIVGRNRDINLDSSQTRLSDNQIRDDLSFYQFDPRFESTQTYIEIKKAWQSKFGKDQSYATIPQIKEDNLIYSDVDVPQYAADVKKYYQEYCSILGCAFTT